MLALVLDMDGTLVASGGTAATCRARPGLVDFLVFAFCEAGVVGVWTAASRTWYELVHRAVLGPALAAVSARLGVECTFSFVWTYERCTHRFEWRGECDTTKRLHKLWRRRAGVFRTMHKHNTLIVDDTASTFAHNYSNAIHVRTYERDVDDDDDDDGCGGDADADADDDDELIALQAYLERVVLVHYAKHATVRSLDKRRWRSSLE